MKTYTFEELFRMGHSLFPNLTREQYFELKFVTAEDAFSEIENLKSEVNSERGENE